MIKDVRESLDDAFRRLASEGLHVGRIARRKADDEILHDSSGPRLDDIGFAEVGLRLPGRPHELEVAFLFAAPLLQGFEIPLDERVGAVVVARILCA